MTNYEKIKNMTIVELAKLLCKLSVCSFCDAGDCCSFGHTGYVHWLEEEAEGSET